MSHILAGTHIVSLDEPCLLLTEQNMQSPGSRGWRRYQILMVMRGDKPAEMRRDLGPAKDFEAQQFRIPGGAKDGITGRFHIEHTVGELIDIADYIRAGLGTQPDLEPKLNLVENYHKEMEARKTRHLRRKSFGHGSLRRVD